MPESLERPRKSSQAQLVVVIVLLVALLVSIVVIINAFIPSLTTKNADGSSGPAPEVALTLWLIIGAAVLLVMIMAVALMSNLIIGQRATPTALGLPEGSISAILALLLLLIFAISSVFLFNQIRAGEGDGFVSRGVTADVLRSLPQERLLEISVENPQAAVAARTYEVRMAAAHPDSIEFGRSSALTIGTLLAAVAGFYFGQRATQSGVNLGRHSGDGGLVPGGGGGTAGGGVTPQTDT